MLMDWLVMMTALNIWAEASANDPVVERVRQIAEEVKAASYPELASAD